jgi:hypothetical protein
MKIIITEEQYNSLNEMIKLDIKVGDTLMGGKFKNKKVVVKTIGKNDKGDITINGKPLLRFRMLKEDDSDDRMIKLFKQWLYSNYDEISFLETKTYDGLPLIVVYHTYESNAANYDTWLAMDIMDSWNKLTSYTIPVMVRWSDKISSETKILIDVEELYDDAEEFSEDEDEPINESVNSKMDNLFDDYMNKLHPDLLLYNIIMRMSSGEDTLYIYTDSTDNVRPGATFFVDLVYHDEVDGKHLYFNEDKYIEEFSNVFGDNWEELFLNWVNKEYKPKLKRFFNEIDWKITGVN